jgi:hypothetical protein
MAKGQRRSNRETKKPKRPKPERNAVTSLTLAPPVAGHRAPIVGRNQSETRKGRK